MIYIVSTVM